MVVNIAFYENVFFILSFFRTREFTPTPCKSYLAARSQRPAPSNQRSVPSNQYPGLRKQRPFPANNAPHPTYQKTSPQSILFDEFCF